MPSTYTDLGFEKQAAGENTNTWGSVHLNNTLDRVNYAIAGYLSIALTGDYQMTSSNSSTTQSDFSGRNSLIKFTGTLSANATITVPSVPMQWMFYNATNKALVITTGSGSTVTVDTGDTIPVYCDGTNVRTLNYGGLSNKDYIAAAVLAATGSLPAVTGNAGKYVYTDGVTSYWKAVSTSDLSDYQTAVLGVQVALAVAL